MDFEAKSARVKALVESGRTVFLFCEKLSDFWGLSTASRLLVPPATSEVATSRCCISIER